MDWIPILCGPFYTYTIYNMYIRIQASTSVHKYAHHVRTAPICIYIYVLHAHKRNNGSEVSFLVKVIVIVIVVRVWWVASNPQRPTQVPSCTCWRRPSHADGVFWSGRLWLRWMAWPLRRVVRVRDVRGGGQAADFVTSSVSSLVRWVPPATTPR